MCIRDRLQPIDDAPQEGTRTRWVGPAVAVAEVGEERGRAGLPGDGAERAGVDHGVRVGKAGVPPGDAGVVVEDVADVPAEDHVADTEAARERRTQLVERDVSAAEDAVDAEASGLGPRD